jgi:hypothetical protein
VEEPVKIQILSANYARFEEKEKKKKRKEEKMMMKWDGMGLITWSGFNPGGTHVYSSRAQPESSSDWECRKTSVARPPS